MNQMDKEERLGRLLVRAALTVAAVLAILLSLRLSGVTAVEEDAPIQMVEAAQVVVVTE